MTVLLDILTWLRPIAHYKVSDQLIIIRVNDIYSEWFMIPLEDPEDQRRLLSMQLTGAWLSEAIEISPDLVDAIAGRCGSSLRGSRRGQLVRVDRRHQRSHGGERLA